MGHCQLSFCVRLPSQNHPSFKPKLRPSLHPKCWRREVCLWEFTQLDFSWNHYNIRYFSEVHWFPVLCVHMYFTWSRTCSGTSVLCPWQQQGTLGPVWSTCSLEKSQNWVNGKKTTANTYYKNLTASFYINLWGTVLLTCDLNHISFMLSRVHMKNRNFFYQRGGNFLSVP